MTNSTTSTTTDRGRFLDYLPEAERRKAAAAFFRAARRANTAEEIVDLVLQWTRADYSQANDAAEQARIRRFGEALRDHRESAVAFAEYTVRRLAAESEPGW